MRRALLAGLLIALSTAGAVYASVQLLADDILPEPLPGFPGLTAPEDGRPQTLMLIGSDRRVGDGRPPLSDTIMLVRLTPDGKPTTVTSIPRDLLVDGERINAAFASGGAAETVKRVKRLLSRAGRPFEINHVITADFEGFRETIDDIGCVYVDVDRDYFNDQGGPGGYAVIDIDPGYQKLCGKDALAYVRYRHSDNDLVRGARQQEFLRQLRRQPGVEALMRPDDLGTLRRIGRMARRSLRVDRSLRQQRHLFRFAKLAMYSATKPVRNVPFAVRPSAGDANSLVATPAMLRRTVDALLGDAKPAERKTERRPRGRGRTAPAPALVGARPAGEDLAIVAARRLDFPFYFPARLTKTAAYVQDPVRTYKLRDAAGRMHDAYRLVLSINRVGQYLGVQGTTWRDPPILEEEPARTVRRRGRTLLVFAEGGRTRMVAWRTRTAVYWVSNTLSRTLSERELIGIAASLSRFGR